MRYIYSLITAAVAFFCCIKSEAQTYRTFQGNINVQALYTPEQAVKGDSGKYSNRQARVAFTLPVYTNVSSGNGGKMHITSWLINGSFTGAVPDMTFLKQQHTFLSPNLGLTAFYYLGEKDTYLGNISVGVNEDTKSINTPQIQPRGFFIDNRTVSQYYSYSLGITYGNLFGVGFPLPIIGMHWHLMDDNLLINVSPVVSIYAAYRVHKSYRFKVFVSPAGSFGYLSNDHTFEGATRTKINLRQNEFHAGLRIESGLTTNSVISLEVGQVFLETLSFNNGWIFSPDLIKNIDVPSSWYAQIGYKYVFPHHLRQNAFSNGSAGAEMPNDEFTDYLNNEGWLGL